MRALHGTLLTLALLVGAAGRAPAGPAPDAPEALLDDPDPDKRIEGIDALGIPLADIRRLAAEGRFSARFDESTLREIAPEYSMFRVLVNVVAEKSRWVEGL